MVAAKTVNLFSERDWGFKSLSSHKVEIYYKAEIYCYIKDIVT